MTIFVSSANVAVAVAVKAAGVQVAWGRGSAAWDTVPESEPFAAAQLVDEIGRRQASLIQYVVADPAGSITLPQGSFSVSSVPTNLLYVLANFAKPDGAGQPVREAAVFIGTKLQAGLPPGQDYFAPGDVSDRGVMLLLERFGRIDRTADFSVALDFVLNL